MGRVTVSLVDSFKGEELGSLDWDGSVHGVFGKDE